jgi:hypothetical protein
MAILAMASRSIILPNGLPIDSTKTNLVFHQLNHVKLQDFDNQRNELQCLV